MKSLAIILGVTNYTNPKLRLPACANDVEVMDTLLRTGGEYTDVIVIRSESSEVVKAELAETIKRFQHEDIENLPFYFSGHGDYADDDFHYHLSDYKESRAATTSLSNKQLDGFLRGLNPALLVKIIDACNSGIPYVKDGGKQFENISSVTKGEFPKCYFYFSSQSDQKSFADERISDFTKAFAMSIVERTSKEVRHLDIINSITDSFKNSSYQIPEFVVQGDFTATFGQYDDDTKSKIRSLISEKSMNDNDSENNSLPNSPSTDEDNVTSVSAPLSIVEFAKKAAIRYATEDQAKQIVSSLEASLKSKVSIIGFEEIFNYNTCIYGNYNGIPNSAAIGKWLNDNKSRGFFADVTTNTEEYTVPAGTGFGALALLANLDGKTTKKTRTVIDGVVTTLSEMPFISFEVSLIPLLPNLVKYSATLTFLLSKNHIEIFYCFTEFKEVEWNKFVPSFTDSWNRLSYELLTPHIDSQVSEEFYKKFSDWLSDKLKDRLKYDPDTGNVNVTPQ